MEEAKNMALLFFMDHLMQKSGRRTIHDLSCQFGARGFTAEMRDAVGTTQEGLTDFLNQHPSLFTVEGDQVSLNGFADMSPKNNPLLNGTTNGRNRDYVREAVQFFEAKLQKFGPELQIKSLLGHRSQAAPEVRLVSGRHLKDFCEFLQSQTEYFVVEGDRVRLKNMPEPSNAVVELDEQGKPLAGVKAKQAAVDYLKSVVEQNEDQPIPMDVFYQKFCDSFSHAVRQEVATNPKELLQFLKLNRNVFFIRSNKVSLVRNRTSEDGSECGSTEGSEQDSNNNNNNNSNGSISIVSSRINYVKSLKTAQEAVLLINADIENTDEKIIAIDFKTVTVGNLTEEFLSLVIVATSNQTHVFDVVHTDTVLLESGLKELFESEKIIKTIHDAKRIATLLAHRYAINLRKIFDTQVAHAVIQHDKFGKPFIDVRSITFVNLRRVYYPQSLMLSDATPRRLSQTPNWTQRPLPDEMLVTVAEEAHYLVTIFYKMLKSLIPNHLRTMFDEKCLEALLPSPNRPPPTSFQSNGAPYRDTRKLIPPVNQIVTGNVVMLQQQPVVPKKCDACTQTFSTGEINVLNVYYDC